MTGSLTPLRPAALACAASGPRVEYRNVTPSRDGNVTWSAEMEALLSFNISQTPILFCDLWRGLNAGTVVSGNESGDADELVTVRQDGGHLKPWQGRQSWDDVEIRD